MPKQGSYPMGTRTLANGDTVTGVVTGGTADVPVETLREFVVSTSELNPDNETAPGSLDGTETWSIRKAGAWARASLSAAATWMFNIFTIKLLGSGTVLRTPQAIMSDQPTILNYGGAGDASTDNYPAIVAMLAAGKVLRFPKNGANQYNFSQPITLTGGQQIYAEAGVALICTGTSDAALVMSGSLNSVKILGQIGAQPTTPYVVRFHDLQYSDIDIRRCGTCATAVIFHDAAHQAANEGNNRWKLGDVEAGSVQYGIKLDSHATFINEGDVWDIEVILSAVQTGMVVGTAGNNKLRFNTYRLSIDSQAITQLMIQANNDLNTFYYTNWSGSQGSYEVQFAAGVNANMLYCGTGTTTTIRVNDQGANSWLIPGANGQMIFGNLLEVSGKNDNGGDFFAVENRSSASVTTKYVAMGLFGRDTINSGKQVVDMQAQPVDVNWSNATFVQNVRRSDAMALGMQIFGTGAPNGAVAAPVGAIYTRQDGGANTTLYVKESGTGNTGWVAK